MRASLVGLASERLDAMEDERQLNRGELETRGGGRIIAHRTGKIAILEAACEAVDLVAERRERTDAEDAVAVGGLRSSGFTLAGANSAGTGEGIDFAGRLGRRRAGGVIE